MLKKIAYKFGLTFYRKVEVKITHHLPKKNIIIIAPRRSGSTLLLDSIRCHPLIDMHPSAYFHELLIPSAPRYPSDLINKINCTQIIEQTVGNFVRIPALDVSNELPVFNLENKEFYNIEKVHPKFFYYNKERFNNNKEYSTDFFISKIKSILKLDKDIDIKFIYGVREPKEVVRSFLRYNQRNKNWGRKQASDYSQLLLDLLNTYKFMSILMKKLPGITIDYFEMQTNLPKILDNIYINLWENDNAFHQYINKKVSIESVKATDRIKKSSINNIFFGKIKDTKNLQNSEFEELFIQYNDDLKKIYDYYQKIKDIYIKHE